MKVQRITNFGVAQNNFALNKKQQNFDINQNYTSIYSKGMSQLYFGGIIPIKTSFAKEIAEQPKVLGHIINNLFKKEGTISGININWTKDELSKAAAINIVASGSSKNAGEMAKAFMEKAADLPVNIISASEFITSKPKFNKNDIMVFVSQSGNTADTLNALKYSKKMGLKTISVTNDVKSKIHKASDVSLYMDAGVENAVAATKTVTSSVVNLWGVAMKLGEIKESFPVLSKENQKFIKALKKLPEQIREMINDTTSIEKISDKICGTSNFYLLAKEPNLGAVNEGALKLTETTQKRVISGSSSEFMHGLFTSIKPFDAYIQAAPGNKTSKRYNLAVENFKEIVNKRMVENPILMKSENNKALEKEITNADFINIPDTQDEFTPLLCTIRFQQLTNSITKNLGINPDNGGGVLTKFRQNLSM